MKTVHMIGNAHIDPVWLWRWREGYAEIKASFQSALDRLCETDDFVFTAACTDYYIWVEQNDPALFAQIAQRIAEGRWRIVGGMWVQPDCNMPSGEAFCRHLLYSQRYFKEKFGITVRTGYNVDSFGHSAMLPQLLARAGIENYVFMRPSASENEHIPAPLFTWQSMDGSAVTAFRIMDGYGTPGGDIEKKMHAALAAADETGYPIMCFYGVGNHGGGPTIRNIRSVLQFQSENPRGQEVIFSSPDQYFEQVADQKATLPVWKSELQHHASGCYSAYSPIKRLNRQAEGALLRSEIFSALSTRLTGHKTNRASLMTAWEQVLFHQFHDVLCGCSIREAYEDAAHALGTSIWLATREENMALQKISWRVDTAQGNVGRKRSKESNFSLWELDGLGTPVVVFNPHGHEATGNITIKRLVKHATDEAGQEIAIQTVRASRTNGEDKWNAIFSATVPAMGYRLYWVYLENEADIAHESQLKATRTSLENAALRIAFDAKTGAIKSIVRKPEDAEMLCAPAVARLYDIEHCDTWAHAEFTFDKEAGAFGDAHISVLEEGPVRATVRVETRYNDSTLVQDYSLSEGADQVEVSARLTLREPFRMVKLCFPVKAQNPVARAEISYGFIERAPNGQEETGHRWMQLGDDAQGIALLNDSKYSFCAQDEELRLTVANSSIYADHYGQQTRDDLCVHMDMGEQHFRYAIVPHVGDFRDARLTERGMLLNMPLEHVVETYHEGDLPAKMQGIAIAGDIVMGALKRSENDDGFIMRLNETAGRQTVGTVNATLLGRRFSLSFAPCEIKTVWIPDDAAIEIRELMITEWEI